MSNTFALLLLLSTQVRVHCFALAPGAYPPLPKDRIGCA